MAIDSLVSVVIMQFFLTEVNKDSKDTDGKVGASHLCFLQMLRLSFC